MRKLFVVVPAETPHGPVKGAFALANALVHDRDVTLVSVKHGAGAQAPLDSRVKRVCLADHADSFRGKVRVYAEMLRREGGRRHVASISLCLSADALNALSRRHAVTCCSVRANMISNYRMDYGWPGVPLAVAHLIGLRRFDRVVAMTQAMADQIRAFSLRRPAIIGNFVDEAALDPFRDAAVSSGPLRFSFVGSLTERKQPWLLVRAIAELRKAGHNAVIDIIGEGPLEQRVREEAQTLGIDEAVRFRGFLKVPYEVLARADAMVLPSLSEGMSRAALESLHLGVPCVLRDVDGNAELIGEGINGALFSSDDALAEAMLRAASINRRRQAGRSSLLPDTYRQYPAARQYLALVESIGAAA